MLFSEAKYLPSGWKEKTDLIISNNPNSESHKKTYSETRTNKVKTEISHKAISTSLTTNVHFHRRKPLSPSLGFFKLNFMCKTTC